MKNKILIGMLLMILLLTNISMASYQTVTMSVVEEPIATIALGANSKFEKKLVAKNLKEKEVTLQLQVTNEEIAEKPTGEIMLVLDDSDSMNETVSSGKTRKDLIFESAKTLISNLLKNNTQLKIGMVSFSTKSVKEEGTIADAKLVSALSNDVTTLTNAISQIKTDGPKTDLQAGLSLASQQYTKTDNNKYMIVLTDGIPNVAVNFDNHYYSDDVIAKTKQELVNLSKQGIQISTMLTGIKDGSTVATGVTKTYDQIIAEIFGTSANPTVGNFYYVTDSEVETTIKDKIYRSLIPAEVSLKDITVVDYFPAEIIKNFDFAYVSNATMGTISSKVDTTNNSITWTVPELKAGATATVQYKLKLKENFDTAILNKVLNTNQKVDLDYTDLAGKKQTKTTDVSPKIKLTEPPAELPKAGNTTFYTVSVLAIGLFTFSAIKLVNLHRKMK